jgi:hypothetical protein
MPLLCISWAVIPALKMFYDGKWIASASSATFMSVSLDAIQPGTAEEKAGKVKVNGQTSIYVSIQNSPMPRVVVDKLLEQIIKCVANIIPLFDPFF